MFRTNGFYQHTNLATENIPVCSFSSNRFKTSDKLIFTSSVSKDVYICPCILLTKYHMQYIRFKSGFSTLVVGNTVFLIKIDGQKDFTFQNEKFPVFEHPYNLFEYLQNKGIDLNNTLQKRQNTNGFIKKQLFLSTGSKKLYSSHREKKKGTSM